MKYKLPSLPGLHAFETAARHENFARAADELNLSQATVSHRVRQLEKYLGFALFERLPRGLRLTDAGKAYLPSIQNSFEQIFASTTGIFGSKDRGTLTVRAPISYASLWLSPIIDDFMEQYPGIEVRLISTVWSEQTDASEVDVDFRLGYGNWKHGQAELIIRESVVPVCNPDLINNAKRPIKEIGCLSRYPLIHVMGIEDLWIKFLAQVGASINVALNDIHVDSVVSALNIVQNSERIALLQKRFVAPYLASGALVTPIGDEMAIEQAIYLVQSTSETNVKPEAILFREWLNERLDN